MQVRELYINGRSIPLSDRTRIGVTYQANNIGELQQRQGTFTNTFKIAITKETQEALEWCNLMTSISVIPYRRNLATYIENGVELVSEGEAIIKNTDKNFFYIDVVGGNMDLSRAIGDLRVGELYTPDDKHVWNLTNVFNSRTGNDYYIYPLIDWRIDIDTFWTSPSADIRQMLPCCIIPEMFDRLAETIGFTFVGDYLTSDDHLNMILTPDEFVKSEETMETESLSSSFTTHDPSIAIAQADINGNFTNAVPEGTGYTTFSVTPSHTVADAGFIGASYYPPENQFGNLRYTAHLTFWWYAPGNYGIFETAQSRHFYTVTRIKKNGTTIAEITSPTVNKILPWDSTDTESQIILDIETGVIALTTGDEYFAQVEFFFERHGNIDSEVKVYKYQSKLQKIPAPQLSFGNDIHFKDIFKMKVSDVMKDILNLRGIVIQTNSYTKEVQFNFFQDIIKNMAIAKDWSDKIDVRQNELYFKFGKYGQRNNLLFKEHETVPQGLGDFYFDVDDQTLEPEITAIQINHPATVEGNRYFGNNIPEIEAINSTNVWQKPGYRILQMNRQGVSFNATFTDGTGNEVTTEDLPYCDFVGFPELVPVHYNALIDILDNTKAIALVTKLTAVDIQELDFIIPIFLDIPQMNINGYFYINRINNYKEGGTSVEYIRL